MPLIRVSEEVQQALQERRHSGQSYNGILEEILNNPGASPPPPSSHVVSPPKKVQVSLDSRVEEFSRDCAREVNSNYSWKNSLAWAVQWWQDKLGNG